VFAAVASFLTRTWFSPFGVGCRGRRCKCSPRWRMRWRGREHDHQKSLIFKCCGCKSSPIFQAIWDLLPRLSSRTLQLWAAVNAIVLDLIYKALVWVWGERLLKVRVRCDHVDAQQHHHPRVQHLVDVVTKVFDNNAKAISPAWTRPSSLIFNAIDFQIPQRGRSSSVHFSDRSHPHRDY